MDDFTAAVLVLHERFVNDISVDTSIRNMAKNKTTLHWDYLVSQTTNAKGEKGYTVSVALRRLNPKRLYYRRIRIYLTIITRPAGASVPYACNTSGHVIQEKTSSSNGKRQRIAKNRSGVEIILRVHRQNGSEQITREK